MRREPPVVLEPPGAVWSNGPRDRGEALAELASASVVWDLDYGQVVNLTLLANGAADVRDFFENAGPVAGTCAVVGLVIGWFLADEYGRYEGATYGAIGGGFFGILLGAGLQ